MRDSKFWGSPNVHVEGNEDDSEADRFFYIKNTYCILQLNLNGMH